MANIIEVLIKASVSPEFRGALTSAADQIRTTEKVAEGMGAKTKASFGSVAASITGSFAAVGLAISGVKQSIELVGNTIKAALGPSAEMQTLQVQFAVLLGGMGEAKDRMQELTKFADTTPFALPEVAKASKVLETLTKGALSTGAGLRMVGDVAAATGQPFDELSVWIGRMYDGLQSGRPVGEALMRMQELGVISGDVRGKIEQLQKEGKKGPEVWGVAEKAFGQYAGMMDAQSKTFEGLSSTMGDSLNGVVREFGNEILPDASGAVGDFTTALNDLKPAASALGWIVSSTVKVFRVAFLGLQAFFSGLIPLILGELGHLLTWSLSTLIGWAEKINSIFGAILPKTWQEGFASNLASAKSWSDGMGETFKAVADESVGYLDTVGGKMAGVYGEREEIAVPGKKKDGKATAPGKEAKDPLQSVRAGMMVEVEEETRLEKLKEKIRDDALKADKAATDRYYKEQEDQQKIRAKQFEERMAAMTAKLAPFMAAIGKVSGAIGGLVGQMTQLAIRGDFSLKALGKATKDMLIGMLADFASFIAQTVAKVLMLMALDALSGGMVSAVMGATGGKGGKGGAGGGGSGFTGMLSNVLKFDVGTPMVPRDMLAMVHQGEMIVPKTFAQGMRDGSVPMGGGSHSASLVLDRDILAVLERNGSAVVKVFKNQGQVAFG